MNEWTAEETAAIVRAARGAPVLCHEQPWELELTGHDAVLREVIGGERYDLAGIDLVLAEALIAGADRTRLAEETP